LFELTFDFVPGAFELRFIHSSYSAVAKQSVVLLGTAALDRRKFIESEAVLLPGDICESKVSAAIARQAVEALGTIDILVNNAALQRPTKISRKFPTMSSRKRFA